MKKLLWILVLGLLLSTSAHAGLFKKKTWLVKNDWDKSQYWDTCKAKVSKDISGTAGSYVSNYKKQKIESEELFSPMHQCLKQMHHNEKTSNTVEPTTTETSNKTELINQAKKTCLDLGFTAGTEKFGDCTLKVLKMK